MGGERGHTPSLPTRAKGVRRSSSSGGPSSLGHGRCTAPASRGGGHGPALGPGLLVRVLGLRDAQGDRGAESAPGIRAPHGAAAHPALLRVVRRPAGAQWAIGRKRILSWGLERAPLGLQERDILVAPGLPLEPAPPCPTGTSSSCRKATRIARPVQRAPSSPKSRGSPCRNTKCGTWRNT